MRFTCLRPLSGGVPVVETDDASLQYETHGEGDPLVFVHGGWVSGQMWEPQVERFADDHEVITVDVRGHGRTGPTDRQRYSLPLFSEDLRKILEREEATDATLVGLSMGSHVAQRYAVDHDVQRAVLAATTRTVPPIPLTQLQKNVFAPKPVMRSIIRSMGVRPYYESLLASIRAIEGHPWVALRSQNRRYVRSEIDTFGTEEYIKVFEALYDQEPPALDRVDAPTMLVHGDHESTSVVQQNRDIEADTGAVRIEVPDAGHLANLDNPRVFNAALESFVEHT